MVLERDPHGDDDDDGDDDGDDDDDDDRDRDLLLFLTVLVFNYLSLKPTSHTKLEICQTSLLGSIATWQVLCFRELSDFTLFFFWHFGVQVNWRPCMSIGLATAQHQNRK